MRNFLIIIGMLTSFGVAAESCILKFSDDKLLSDITQGKEIHTPFQLGSLIEGKHEPEIKYEKLKKSSINKIIKTIRTQYNYAITKGAQKLIKENKESKKIIFRGPDSGYYIEFKFKEKNGCWKLVGFTNAST